MQTKNDAETVSQIVAELVPSDVRGVPYTHATRTRAGIVPVLAWRIYDALGITISEPELLGIESWQALAETVANQMDRLGWLFSPLELFRALRSAAVRLPWWSHEAPTWSTALRSAHRAQQPNFRSLAGRWAWADWGPDELLEGAQGQLADRGDLLALLGSSLQLDVFGAMGTLGRMVNYLERLLVCRSAEPSPLFPFHLRSDSTPLERRELARAGVARLLAVLGLVDCPEFINDFPISSKEGGRFDERRPGQGHPPAFPGHLPTVVAFELRATFQVRRSRWSEWAWGRYRLALPGGVETAADLVDAVLAGRDAL